jgi:hypothetical protein
MGSGLRIERWTKQTLLGARFYFRIVDELNNERLLVSQRYKTKAQRNETSARFSGLLRAPIKDVSK